jgi:hypothetical protein
MFTMNCESDDEQDDHLSIAQVEAKLLSEFVVQDKKEQKEEKQGSDPCIPKDKEGIEREENEEKSSALNGEADNEMEGEEKLDQTERWEDYPLKDIEEPHGHDVLFGRGGEYTVWWNMVSWIFDSQLLLNFYFFLLQEARITTKVISSIGRWLKIIK